jgi:hypothetical protein
MPSMFFSVVLTSHTSYFNICISDYFGLSWRDSVFNVRLFVLVILEFQMQWEEQFAGRILKLGIKEER